LRRIIQVISIVNLDRQVCNCWQGTYMSFGGEHLKVNAQPWAGRRVRGTFHAKESLEQVMVNKLPSKTKDILCGSYSYRFLPVPS
jgi:hypothetical protein